MTTLLVPKAEPIPELTDGQDLAARLLNAVRMHAAADDLVREIAQLEREELTKELNTDAKRKAFWINLYNAFSQIHLSGSQFVNLGPAGSLFYFEKKLFRVAGIKMSLNDVEHGILRRSRIWWAGGFLKKIAASAWERKFRVDLLDPRIHFALNCAAKSCPPIRFYEAEKIEEQLDLATAAYLQATVKFDAAENVLQIPQLFQFFPADFAGKGLKMKFLKRRKNIIQFLNSYGKFLDPENRPVIRYLTFDRTASLGNYAASSDE